jgi:hypothetical protein
VLALLAWGLWETLLFLADIADQWLKLGPYRRRPR